MTIQYPHFLEGSFSKWVVHVHAFVCVCVCTHVFVCTHTSWALKGRRHQQREGRHNTTRESRQLRGGLGSKDRLCLPPKHCPGSALLPVKMRDGCEGGVCKSSKVSHSRCFQGPKTDKCLLEEGLACPVGNFNFCPSRELWVHSSTSIR